MYNLIVLPVQFLVESKKLWSSGEPRKSLIASGRSLQPPETRSRGPTRTQTRLSIYHISFLKWVVVLYVQSNSVSGTFFCGEQESLKFRRAEEELDRQREVSSTAGDQVHEA